MTFDTWTEMSISCGEDGGIENRHRNVSWLKGKLDINDHASAVQMRSVFAPTASASPFVITISAIHVRTNKVQPTSPAKEITSHTPNLIHTP